MEKSTRQMWVNELNSNLDNKIGLIHVNAVLLSFEIF